MAAQLGSTPLLAEPLQWRRSSLQPRPQRAFSTVRASGDHGVYLLDYGAGNVRSVRNACKKLGCELNEASHKLLMHALMRVIMHGQAEHGQSDQPSGIPLTGCSCTGSPVYALHLPTAHSRLDQTLLWLFACR